MAAKIDLDEYNRLKKSAEKAKADADRAEGALEQQMKKLEADFGCKTLDEARSKLVQLQKQESDAVADYEQKLAVYKEKWGSRL